MIDFGYIFSLLKEAVNDPSKLFSMTPKIKKAITKASKVYEKGLRDLLSNAFKANGSKYFNSALQELDKLGLQFSGDKGSWLESFISDFNSESFAGKTLSRRIQLARIKFKLDFEDMIKHAIIQKTNPEVFFKQLKNRLKGQGFYIGASPAQYTKMLLKSESGRMESQIILNTARESGARYAKWTLSMEHKYTKPHEVCEVLSQQDKGYGSGIYLISEYPDPPHSRCKCIPRIIQPNKGLEMNIDLS